MMRTSKTYIPHWTDTRMPVAIIVTSSDISNQFDCLLNSLLGLTRKETSKVCIIGPFCGETIGKKGQKHGDVIKWIQIPLYWPFLRGIHRSQANSPHKGQWRRALSFSLIYTWIKGCVNNREAGNSRRHRAHYDVIVMNAESVSVTSHHHGCCPTNQIWSTSSPTKKIVGWNSFHRNYLRYPSIA